jgi:hypothetical protein
MPYSLNGRLNCIEHVFGSWTSWLVQRKTHLIVGFRMIAERLIRGALSTPLDVQVFGAVIMWVIGYIVFLVPPMQIAPELGRGREAE